MISLLVCLFIISIYDIREKRIPNNLVVAIYLIGILNLCAGQVSNACLDLSGRVSNACFELSGRVSNALFLIPGQVSNAECIVGLLILPIMFLLVLKFCDYKLGMGDIKLISAIGFALGFRRQVLLLIVGMSLCLIVLAITRKKSIFLAPFISFGALFALIIG